MSKLISGKEALIALANGEEVEYKEDGCSDWNYDIENLVLNWIKHDHYQFRLKPRTISINGVEVPAPFKPKNGDKTYYLNDGMTDGYRESEHLEHFEYHFGTWRNEAEIKQVVAALRQVFGGSYDN